MAKMSNDTQWIAIIISLGEVPPSMGEGGARGNVIMAKDEARWQDDHEGRRWRA